MGSQDTLPSGLTVLEFNDVALPPGPGFFYNATTHLSMGIVEPLPVRDG